MTKLSGFFDNVKEKYSKIGYKAKKHTLHILGRIFTYVVLTLLAFLFILPFVYIISTSMMSSTDYLDPTVQYIPTHVQWKNFVDAWDALNYQHSAVQTLGLSVTAMILQTVSCALCGYALGRFKFKGRNLLFVLVILVLLIPPQSTILASYGMFSTLKMINTWGPVVLPSLFGLGIRGALFILIYMYFFQRIPDVMDDAARIDGAGPVRVFFQIMLPLVRSAIIIVAIFSFVWHWNDNYEAPMYLYDRKLMTLQPRLENIKMYFSDYVSQSSAGATAIDKAMTEPMLFAGCLLVMLPVLIVYIFGQKHLAAGIERIGVIE
ncbi:MAG: carbohydrate ABC transporter permease [Clostridia bacterium]|nr:carbohydrate ABC transporter permease [Clostridia bacterium]